MSSLHSTLVFFSNYLASFNSQPSKPSKSRNTLLVRDQLPKVTNLEVALKVFDEMLQTRPLLSVVRFNQILGQVAKLKHYSVVLSLYKQMGVLEIASDVYTLSIIINCYCQLKQMGFSLSVLGKFFKFGFEPDVTTLTTLINGLLLVDRMAEAAGLFSEMVEGGNCKAGCSCFWHTSKGLLHEG